MVDQLSAFRRRQVTRVAREGWAPSGIIGGKATVPNVERHEGLPDNVNSMAKQT